MKRCMGTSADLAGCVAAGPRGGACREQGVRADLHIGWWDIYADTDHSQCKLLCIDQRCIHRCISVWTGGCHNARFDQLVRR